MISNVTNTHTMSKREKYVAITVANDDIRKRYSEFCEKNHLKRNLGLIVLMDFWDKMHEPALKGEK